MTAPESPRVRRLVVFKHGVAYLERGGPASGPFELSFRRDEMNDVLKSFAVWVADGEGTVGAATFEAPEDPAKELAERGLLLEPGTAFRGLLQALRGRRVVVDVGGNTQTGEVIGVDRDQDGEGRVHERLLIRDGDGQVALLDAHVIRRVALDEETSRADLAWLVDKSRAANDREHRRVRVDLSGTVEDLRVAYTIPAPMWRVSYRVVANDDDDVTLMAWAIVHNPADEDLEGVSLTLTTGQPVSFVTELYQPRTVARARLEESDRAVASPRKIERAKRTRSGGPPPPPQMRAAPAPAAPAPGGMVTHQYSAAEEAATIGVDAAFAAEVDSGDRAEHFEYRVGRPVTLKRGGSAMVPILSAEVKTKRERIWRDGQGPAPDIVLRFDNTSNAVLEEGPSVIYDGGSYGGEAMVPYSARGAEVRLPFARDLAVRCSRSVENSVRLDGIRIKGLVAWERHQRRDSHTLVVESDHDEPVTVIFEVPKRTGHEVVEGLSPVEETTDHWRFAVEAAPRETTEATFVERWLHDYRLNMERLDMHRFKTWAAADKLDPATSGTLRGVMQTWQQATDLESQAQDFDQEMAALTAQAEAFKEQLGVLRSDGEEGALRMRWVHELSQLVDRQKAIYAEQKRLRAEAEQLRQQARDVLSKIDVGE
jgi:hypothetical protein